MAEAVDAVADIDPADPGERIEARIEAHSIDYIPKAERHGKAWHQGTFWFASNVQLATLAIGLIGISLGLNLFWSIIGYGVGLLTGTLFMATHSIQGPRTGVPQMIQSRPQFGFLGALWPQAIVIFLYVGFNVFNTILAGQALAALTPLSTNVAIVLSALIALGLAAGGYRWLHVAQRWGTWAFLACFGVFTVGAIVTLDVPAAQTGTGNFHLAPFLVVVFAAASYVISEAPYVSDYSRYLRPSTSSRQCFWWTYGGATLGSFWMIGLGAFLLAVFPNASPTDVITKGGNAIFDGFGEISLTLAFLMLLPTIAVNMYGGSLTALTIWDSIKPLNPTVAARVAGLTVIGVVATVLALLLPSDFLTNYNNFLALLLYFLIPWSAINLMDFYVIRRGDYVISEIFKRDGIYGLWQWRGLLSYTVGFAVMIPFFSISLFTGPVAKQIDGVDLSIFVGLFVSAGLYYLLTHNLDKTEEHALALADDPEAQVRAH